MSSLEWIEKQIKYLEKMCSLNPTFIKKDLECLYQIKIELEAWEVVKPNIEFEDLGEMQSGNAYRGYFNDCLDEEEYNKIEKALEAK